MNAFAVLAPWVAVIGLVGCIGTVVVVRKRKSYSAGRLVCVSLMVRASGFEPSSVIVFCVCTP